MAINQDKLHEFLGKAIVDFGAVFSAALIRIGDKLGLYKALSSGGPQTPAELARKTNTTERYVREWLSNQAAGGYVNYDAATGKFHMSEEQTFAMADESSPVFLPGAFQCALAATKAEEQLTERFKTGEGLGWHEHHHELFVGTERFFRPGYAANLIASWLLAMFDASAKPVYRDRAEKWFRVMKSRMKLKHDGTYEIWNYWEPAGAWDYKSNGLPKHWIGVHPNAQYYDFDVEGIVAAYEHGLVFNKDDINRLVATAIEETRYWTALVPLLLLFGGLHLTGHSMGGHHDHAPPSSAAGHERQP